MREDPIRPAPDEPAPGHHEDAHVPILAQGRDGPVPQGLDEQEERERHGPPRRRLRTAQESLDERAGEPQGMHGDHRRVMPPPPLHRPPRPQARLVAPRVPQLEQTLQRHERHDDHEDDRAHRLVPPRAGSQPLKTRMLAAASRQHLKNTCSAEKPGPIAESTPCSPGARSAPARKRSRIKSTVTLDMFPCSRRTSREMSRPPGSRPNTPSKASSTLAPPGWIRGCRMSSKERPTESSARLRFSGIRS